MHKAFDALPEEVFPRLFSLQSSSDPVQRWHRMLARRGVDIEGYQQISSDLATDADAIRQSGRA